jgi:chain length determinant protein (polysaccharide antigen chain regulator)
MDGALVYMRGSKALEAEISNLRARTSDDPFITDLRSREEALTFYNNLEVKDSVFEVYRQDGGVEAPDRPVKPNKLLIIALGIIGGLFIGVVIAVMRGLTTRSKA